MALAYFGLEKKQNLDFSNKNALNYIQSLSFRGF
jgi:hypothetical protein